MTLATISRILRFRISWVFKALVNATASNGNGQPIIVSPLSPALQAKTVSTDNSTHEAAYRFLS
jgi:hypothetical protein